MALMYCDLLIMLSSSEIRIQESAEYTMPASTSVADDFTGLAVSMSVILLVRRFVVKP